MCFFFPSPAQLTHRKKFLNQDCINPPVSISGFCIIANSSATSSTSEFDQTTTENLIKTIVSPQSQLVTVHLEEDNYLLWKAQVETAVRGYGLEDFLNGTVRIPPRFITSSKNTTINNPEFVKYQRQDNLICSWLLSSISVKLPPQVIGSKTANGVWSTVERIFNSQSAAKVMHHKRQLKY